MAIARTATDVDGHHCSLFLAGEHDGAEDGDQDEDAGDLEGQQQAGEEDAGDLGDVVDGAGESSRRGARCRGPCARRGRRR